MTDEQIRPRSPRPKLEHETTTNSSVWRKRHKELHACCSYCRWHKGENMRNYRRFGNRMPKRKDHRQGHNPRTIQESAA